MYLHFLSAGAQLLHLLLKKSGGFVCSLHYFLADFLFTFLGDSVEE